MPKVEVTTPHHSVAVESDTDDVRHLATQALDMLRTLEASARRSAAPGAGFGSDLMAQDDAGQTFTLRPAVPR